MATITKDLGVATAYGYAVAGGYTGTEEEFAELMASYASVAQEAEESAETAEAYAKGTVDGTPVGSGETGYHDNAKYYKDEAAGSATDADNSATAASGSASGASASALKSEGHAVGQQNGSDVGSGSPYYHNNAKYYKEQASGSASEASGSAGTAADQALVSEGYAKGTQSGTPVASGTYYHDNAKYYKEQADGDASSASASATAANADALKAEGYAVGKQNGTDVGSGSPYYENNAKHYASEAADSATEAAASAASIDPDTLAKVDGYYESMTVGNAEQLVATVGVEDSVPFNFRTTGGSADVGDRKTMEVVGGTVAWNQLARNNGDLKNVDTVTKNGVTFTYLGNNKVSVQTDENGATANAGIPFCIDIPYMENHVYVIGSCPSGANTNYGYFLNVVAHGTSNQYQMDGYTVTKFTLGPTATNQFGIFVRSGKVITTPVVFSFQMFDLTQMFGSTIADYIYSLEQANAGAGVAWFKKLFPKPYYAYNAGELMSVKTSAYKSVGFNQWDEEWETGGINYADGTNTDYSTRLRSKNLIPVKAGSTYYIRLGADGIATNGLVVCFYDASGTYVSGAWRGAAFNPFTIPDNVCYMRFCTGDGYGGTYHNDICINLSWDGERDGEYEPYEEHTYALDSDLELRGIPKLDADNQLYYDGDTYEADGAVARKYGIVDLGTETWTRALSNGHYRFSLSQFHTLPGAKTTGGYDAAAICSNYPSNYAPIGQNDVDDCFAIYNGIAIIRDDSYETGEAFKTAMSGVQLVYELATPGEETADPFQTPQIVNDFGTEEFVDARTIPIPVGHNSKYQANLRAKLEMAPNSPSGDGDYIVRQASGQNTYVPITFPADELPAAPTTDGNYVLKCTVSSGTATFTWEAQT